MHHILCGLAANPALPAPLLDRLIALADEDVAEVLASRADLTRPQTAALLARVPASAARLASEGRLTAADIDPATQPEAALTLLREGRGDPEHARALIAHGEALAACPGLPPDVVARLAADDDVQVVAELALWATGDVLLELARHPHAEVRRAAAVNEATPASVLAALLTGEGVPAALRCLVCDREDAPFVHDPSCPRTDCDLRAGASCDGTHESTVHDTRLAAVQHPSTPVAALLTCVDDHSSLLVRWALAARRDLPPEAYERLVRSNEPGVRAELAENPAIGEALMRMLAGDAGHDVRRRLAHNPRVPLDVLVRLAGGSRIGGPAPLPRVVAASREEVEELARSASPAVRMLVARRRDLPDGVRDVLAWDADAKVAGSVASHPGLDDGQLRALVDRHGVRVVAQVAANPDAAPELLEDIGRREPGARKALREIARHPRASGPALRHCLADGRARVLAAAHPNLPPDAVVELLGDPGGEVVEAAAAHPALPREVMAELLAGAWPDAGRVQDRW
ncbi:hypothetical protein [Streptomyces sp. NPDC060194]|uniref:hypothetical protein n=1 Tax=Streptomyces sp. NPDC060194 TaxID=3347069 RepID=UPI0036533BE4